MPSLSPFPRESSVLPPQFQQATYLWKTLHGSSQAFRRLRCAVRRRIPACRRPLRHREFRRPNIRRLDLATAPLAFAALLLREFRPLPAATLGSSREPFPAPPPA